MLSSELVIKTAERPPICGLNLTIWNYWVLQAVFEQLGTKGGGGQSRVIMSTLKACLKRARECLAGEDFPGAIEHCRAALQHDSQSYDALV